MGQAVRLRGEGKSFGNIAATTCAAERSGPFDGKMLIC
jgi:hypothetical protein